MAMLKTRLKTVIGARAYSLAYFGRGTGTIHLDNVHCTGTEQTLLSCSHSTSTTDCGHHEDAGVTCNAGKHSPFLSILTVSVNLSFLSLILYLSFAQSYMYLHSN